MGVWISVGNFLGEAAKLVCGEHGDGGLHAQASWRLARLAEAEVKWWWWLRPEFLEAWHLRVRWRLEV